MRATESTWRKQARAVIWKVIEEHGQHCSTEQLMKKIRAAYPFGPREMWPYQCWLNEVRAAEQRLRGLRLHELSPEEQEAIAKENAIAINELPLFKSLDHE